MITNGIPGAEALEKRSTCTACYRPLRVCICRWVLPLHALPEVLILQHPLEVNHPKGSARLLHLSLRGSRLAVGEIFSEAMLQTLLYLPFESRPDGPDPASKKPMLLYPESDIHPSAASTPEEIAGLDPAQVRLVVLDGTWRKSSKMLHANPLLQTLPRLALQSMPASRYGIRRAHRKDQLSTLEASCYALAQLEKNEAKYQPLLTAFDAFVAEQKIWFKR